MTPPWNAPEHTRRERSWTVCEAERMDIFSFSMLCVWFLFETYLSHSSSIPEETLSWAANCFSETDTRNILRNLKGYGKLFGFAEQMLNAESRMVADMKVEWKAFLRLGLSQNPDDRDMSKSRLFDSQQLS
jgi:hypothetical protein